MNTIELRQNFLNYFRKHNHKFMKQSQVYLDNDPTLFFVNAGMNQLKDVFLGNKQPGDHNKLMNSQICIRAGGKHNDFDDVGRDSYHLTSFEMLGNWEIDCNNKENPIELAFNYLVDELHLNKDQIYITYFEGNDTIPADIETKEIWKKYVNEDKIIKGNANDNFWLMGDSGPCGFCTEIHYDLLGNRDANNLVNTNDNTVIEIWNIVFIQFNKVGDEYLKLPKMFIDTGCGLERLSMILQNKNTLYDTDAFKYIMGCAQLLSNSDFYTNSYQEDNTKDLAYRIFADHMRTSTVAVFQGVKFDSHGRGYILRKIFRRLLVYYYMFLANGSMTPIMKNKEINILISRILNYFLFYTHDANIIQEKFIKEEKLALDKWTYIKIKFNKCSKDFNGDAEKIMERLKTKDGIDDVICKNIKLLK